MNDSIVVQVTDIIKDYTVYNPDFIRDVIKFLGLALSEDEVSRQIDAVDQEHPLTPGQKESGALTAKEKLNVFIDRIEFIHHLKLVSDFAVQSHFRILGQEVRGIQWDIKALRVYLSLTCIDIFHSSGDHKTHFENVFLNTSDEIKAKLKHGMRILSSAGMTDDLRELATFFYDIRNYYTHAGKRFHVLEGIPVAQMQDFPVGTQKHKETKTLLIADGFSLIDCILEVATYEALKLFEWI